MTHMATFIDTGIMYGSKKSILQLLAQARVLWLIKKKIKNKKRVAAIPFDCSTGGPATRHKQSLLPV